MGGACGTDEEEDKHLQVFWSGTPEERDKMEDLCLDGRIILEWVLR